MRGRINAQQRRRQRDKLSIVALRPDLGADDPMSTQRTAWHFFFAYLLRKERTLEARQFWAEMVGSKEAMMTVEELDGFEEVARAFLDLLPPEKRVIGLTPEQCMAGLAPEQ